MHRELQSSNDALRLEHDDALERLAESDAALRDYEQLEIDYRAADVEAKEQLRLANAQAHPLLPPACILPRALSSKRACAHEQSAAPASTPPAAASVEHKCALACAQLETLSEELLRLRRGSSAAHLSARCSLQMRRAPARAPPIMLTLALGLAATLSIA